MAVGNELSRHVRTQKAVRADHQLGLHFFLFFLGLFHLKLFMLLT